MLHDYLLSVNLCISLTEIANQLDDDNDVPQYSRNKGWHFKRSAPFRPFENLGFDQFLHFFK